MACTSVGVSTTIVSARVHCRCKMHTLRAACSIVPAAQLDLTSHLLNQ